MNYTSTKYAHQSTNEETNDKQYAILDSGADTIGISGEAWYCESFTSRTVSVSDFNNMVTMNNRPVVTAITATDLPDGTTILLRANEATN